VGGVGSKQQYIFGLGADIEGVDDVDDAERSAVEDVDGTQVSMMSMVLWAASHNRIIFLRDEFLSRRSGRYTRMTATRRASKGAERYLCRRIRGHQTRFCVTWEDDRGQWGVQNG